MEASQIAPEDLPQKDPVTDQQEETLTDYEMELRMMMFGLLQITNKIIDQTHPTLDPLELLLVKALDMAVQKWSMDFVQPSSNEELYKAAAKLQDVLKESATGKGDQEMQFITDEIVKLSAPEA